MKKRKKSLFQKTMVVILSAALVVGMLPTSALAAETKSNNFAGGGICEHHTQHDDTCGYREAVDGSACSHAHTADCYVKELICEVEESDEHSHSEECYEEKLNCNHVHDEECGYREAVEENACGFVCEICSGNLPEDTETEDTETEDTEAEDTETEDTETENIETGDAVGITGANAAEGLSANNADIASDADLDHITDGQKSAVSSASIENPYSGVVCLNGTPVIITEGADSSKTKLYEDKNSNGILDGDELPIELPNEAGSLEDGYDLSFTQICGGKSGEACTGDVTITMLGGNIFYIEGTYTGDVTGNFNLRMTGGRVQMITSAAAGALNGNSEIVIGGNAAVTNAVYGGALNSDVTIGGNVSITIEGNAQIGSGSSDDGVFAGGQQDGSIIAGTGTITVKGGTVNGQVYSDLFDTTFTQGVTIDIQGGNITGFVQGITNIRSQTPSVAIKIGNAAIGGSVIGVHNAYVENTSIRIDGGTVGGQLIGAWAAKAGTVSIEVNSGSVQGLIVGKANPNGAAEESWKKGTIAVSGGSFNERIMLCNNGVSAPELSEIKLSGNPVFGENGCIVLREGESILQTGAVTGGDGSVRVNAANVNQEGTLIVRPAEASVTLDPKVFTLLNSSWSLVFGDTAESNKNLYLGTEKAPDDEGEIIKEVNKGENAPDTSLAITAKELADMVLTEAEKNQVEGGTDIKIVLDVEDASDTVGGEDKAKVEAALNGYAVGQYLDISLYKLIGDSRTNITETPQKLTITIAIPDRLKNMDSQVIRTFAVIGVHGGSAELLNDLDTNADTITIATDHFSTYAIVYKDTAKSEGGGDEGGGSGSGSGDSGSESGGGSGDGGSESGGSGSGDSGSGSSDSGNGGSGSSDNGSGSSNSNSNANSSNSNVNNNGSSDNSSNNGGSGNTSNSTGAKTGKSKDGEPKTGDSTPLELYATLAMIAGFTYLLLYFTDRKGGMTEETKKELVSKLIRWAKRGGKIRKLLALTAIFVLLVYYHSIGKNTCVEWEKVYS